MWNTTEARDITPFVQSYVARHAPAILRASRVTGVPAETIAAAISEEMMENFYKYKTFPTTKSFCDWAEDSYAKGGSTQFPGWIRGLWSRMSGLVEKDELPKGYLHRLTDLLADDLGPFNLGIAIRLVHKSLGDRQAEALNLRRYAAGNNAALVKDLHDLDSPTTVNLTAYYLQEAEAFFQWMFGQTWSAASDQTRAAWMVIYFKTGEKGLLPLLIKHGLRLDGPNYLSDHDPSRVAGGPFVLKASNYAKIRRALERQHIAPAHHLPHSRRQRSGNSVSSSAPIPAPTLPPVNGQAASDAEFGGIVVPTQRRRGANQRGDQLFRQNDDRSGERRAIPTALPCPGGSAWVADMQPQR
jgi:hypothetical protein